MVEIALNKYRGQFYLDTGARGMHLPRQIAETIPELQLTGRKIRSIDLAGKIRENDEFIIPNVQINGMIFHDVMGQFLSDWGLGKSELQLPVIGFDVLQQKELVIDFAHKRLLMSDVPIAFEKRYSPTQDIPLLPADEGLAISVHLDKQEWPFVLDSGASISMIKDSANIDSSLIIPCALELPGGRCEMVNASVAYGNKRINIQLFRMPLPEAFKPMGIIGHDFFRQCALYLSPNHDMMKMSCTRDSN